MKTQKDKIDKTIYGGALRATSEKRMSMPALENKDGILSDIQSDVIMRQRWDRYCKEYFYANGIGLYAIIEVLKEIVK